MLLPSGDPFKCHEEVLYLQPLIPPKRFDIFPPDWGMLRKGLGAFRFFFKQQLAISLVRPYKINALLPLYTVVEIVYGS